MEVPRQRGLHVQEVTASKLKVNERMLKAFARLGTAGASTCPWGKLEAKYMVDLHVAHPGPAHRTENQSSDLPFRHACNSCENQGSGLRGTAWKRDAGPPTEFDPVGYCVRSTNWLATVSAAGRRFAANGERLRLLIRCWPIKVMTIRVSRLLSAGRQWNNPISQVALNTSGSVSTVQLQAIDASLQ
jgi:hypothetical protein